LASRSLSHVVACTVTCAITDVRSRCGRLELEARRAVQLREKELEVDRLRRKLAKKEAKERQPQLSSASHLVRAPTPTGVGLTEEELVAVLNREMERRRQEEEQRAIEARHIQQMETERLRRQSLESKEPCLEVPSIVVPVSSIDTRSSGLTASQ